VINRNAHVAKCAGEARERSDVRANVPSSPAKAGNPASA
jgi:hypothetical protein